ncbi:Dot/Icm type IV secretion system effector CoxH3 [soil metagenome]
MTTETEETTFPSRDGLNLQAAIDVPPGEVRAVLVLCHPHPKMGGTMTAPLLLAVRDELASRRVAVVRFNFRGIGESEGDSSTGIEEMKDAGGAIDLARARWPKLPLAIGGWSFGAAVAVRVASREQGLFACVAVAPPAEPEPEVTEGLPDPSQLPADLPVLVVIGERDDIIDIESCREWVEQTHAELVTMRGANHFFWAQYEPLAAGVADFLDESLAAGS